MAKSVKQPAKAPAAKKTTAATSTEVAPVVLTPEQYEIELQKKINSDIKKYSLPDKAIAEMKKRYAGLTVKDLTDKEGIKALKAALSDVTGTRTGIENKRKELKADYLRIGKAIDEEAKRLTELVTEIEEPLKAEKLRIDQLEREEKERKAREEEERLQSRVATIKEAGMSFDGNFYVIANMSMDVVTLKAMKDSDFEFLVAKVKIEAERIAKEEEERRQAELARQEEERKQREELERQQKELEEQQRKMREEREAFQRQQEEFAEQQRKAQQEEENRKAAILKELIDTRTSALESLGFVFIPSIKQFIYQNEAGKHSIYETTLSTASPEYWQETVKLAKIEIQTLDIKHDEIVEARKEEERQKAIEEENRKRKEEEERIAEEKRKADEAEAARLAALPDVEKVLQYVRDLKAVAVPAVTNEEMGATLLAIGEMLTEMDGITVQELEAVKKPSGE